jgi:endogenous inhibitor of DNA gyrase (YacG/DUF329 family)
MMSKLTKVETMPVTGLICPQCRRPVEWKGNEFRPFCSERCRMVDLGAWVDESYRISADRLDPEDSTDKNSSQ